MPPKGKSYAAISNRMPTNRVAFFQRVSKFWFQPHVFTAFPAPPLTKALATRRGKESGVPNIHVCTRHRQTPKPKHEMKTRHVELPRSATSYSALVSKLAISVQAKIRYRVRSPARPPDLAEPLPKRQNPCSIPTSLRLPTPCVAVVAAAVTSDKLRVTSERMTPVFRHQSSRV